MAVKHGPDIRRAMRAMRVMRVMREVFTFGSGSRKRLAKQIRFEGQGLM